MQLCTVPIFLHFWGVDLYGEWLLLSAIPAYLAMSDMGFSSVAGNRMTMQVAESKQYMAVETYQSTLIFLVIVSTSILIIASLSFFLPLDLWFHLKEMDKDIIGLIITLLTLGVVIGLQNSLIEIGFRSDGNYSSYVWISNITRLGEFILVAISVYFGSGPVLVASIPIFTRVISFIFAKKILRKKSPWIHYGINKAKTKTILSLLVPSIDFMALPIGNALKNQGMLTIVGIVLGPIAVVSYSTTRSLLSSVQQGMSIINNSIWPEISSAYGSGKVFLIQKIHRVAVKISLILALILIIFLALYGIDFIYYWTNKKVMVDHLFFNLMLLSILINSLWLTSSIVLVATNNHEKMARLYLIFTISCSLITYLLVPIFGLSGIAVGMLLIDIAMAVTVLSFSLNLVKDSPINFFIYLLNPLLIKQN